VRSLAAVLPDRAIAKAGNDGRGERQEDDEGDHARLRSPAKAGVESRSPSWAPAFAGELDERSTITPSSG
jgi:hypothetical protein